MLPAGSTPTPGSPGDPGSASCSDFYHSSPLSISTDSREVIIGAFRRGDVDIAGSSELLSFLFRKGPPPASPFRNAGPDPTPDALDCRRFSP